MAKIRLDILVQKHQSISREKAQALILAGLVEIDGKLIDKPGTKIDETSDIKLKDKGLKYVSRGGLKLEKAINDFNIDFTNKIVLDVGASTGGYTDCALQNGAAKVIAVDVGYGQLDWKLRQNPKVVNLERTNIRYLTIKDIREKVDIATMDVSFISTIKVYPVLKELLLENGEIVSLIKPQFEAGKDKVGKNGVVRNSNVHIEVLENCIKAAEDEGLYCNGVSYSPITGPKGNIEYFIYLKKSSVFHQDIKNAIKEAVDKAHETVEGKHN
ncbi:RNA binding methyltransferase FtsJ like [Candidatus Syntrophocurvum alkaliphilum]|uniref:RNA binding methyltransferase FtsJ like n=1 Tax=Candidatus Syntrophocurvum alkaliphilum TaxID=2293317 RepID=A0A6I6DCX0_9FIRM|nr:TlyA family RNA methyltransferase [Candidatus Syntrophocurvum alkaliphilum]QGT98970.1 RNA binding methyltransferase FtsJ like [Candidatus Syntrophocurvum alkaliphilum]